MAEIKIADVMYTVTDETFYVLNRPHKDAANYLADTLEATKTSLTADGWVRCGGLPTASGYKADMYRKNETYIAVWQEN